jgi:hypothetical protein
VDALIDRGTQKLVFSKLSVCSFIAFAKLVYPQQRVYLVKRDYKVNEDSQALVNLSTRSRLSAQLEIKHSFLSHLVIDAKTKNNTSFFVKWKREEFSTADGRSR